MEIDREGLSRIKELLKNHPRGMNVTEIAREIGMNRISVAKYLEMLVISGHIDVKAFGPAKVFFLSNRLPISGMLSLSSDFIVILDKDLRIVNINDKFLEFAKIGREDILYQKIDTLSFPLEFEPPIMSNIINALNGRESTIDAYYKRKGRDIFFNIKFIPLVFDDGQKGVTILIEDITERKRIEAELQKSRDELERRVLERTAELNIANEALRKSEEKYRSIIENVSDCIWEVNNEMKFSYINPRSYPIIGFTQEEMLGRPLYEFMENDEANRFISSLSNIARDKRPFSCYEYIFIHKDGHAVNVEVSGEPILDAQGALLGYRGITRDVTQRKKDKDVS